MRTPSCRRGAPLRPLRSRWNYQVWNSFLTLENVFQTSHSRYERWMAFEQKLNQFSLNWKSLRSLTVDWISFLLSGQGPIVGSGAWTIYLKIYNMRYFGWKKFCLLSYYEGLFCWLKFGHKYNWLSSTRMIVWLRLAFMWLQFSSWELLIAKRILVLIAGRAPPFATPDDCFCLSSHCGLVSIFSSHHHIHNSRPGVFNLKQISPCTTSGMYNTLKTKFKIFCIF